MLIVYFVCKIKKKAPLKGLIFDIKGIQIGKMLEKQMQFILSPLHKAINYDKSFAWFKNRLKGPKHHALKAQAPGASALSGRVKFSVISRGNVQKINRFPRLITHFPLLFCAKRCFYPISRRIATQKVSRWMLFPYMTTAKLLITVINRGNLPIFSTFPRLIIYLFVSLQHNKQIIYRKI